MIGKNRGQVLSARGLQFPRYENNRWYLLMCIGLEPHPQDLSSTALWS